MIKWDHNFVHVATAQLFLHVHNCGLVASLESKVENKWSKQASVMGSEILCEIDLLARN